MIVRNVRSIIEEAQEQSRSNAPLVALHAKLVTVLWIIMGLEMKSVKPLSLFNTTVNIETLERLRFTFTPNGKRQIQVENFSE